MSLDVRQSQTILENLLRDTVLYALGQRLPQVASIAALRAVPTAGATSTMRNEDDLITVAGAPITAFRWNQQSSAADNGATVVKPYDVAANGRWLAWTSLQRFSTTVGGNSATLDQITTGPLARVILIDRDFDADEINALLTGQVPAVFIEATDDQPVDMNLDTGFRWDTAFEFTVSVLTENLRDRREAAQGSAIRNDSIYGANTIDGFLKALLCGTQLSATVEGVRNVKVGRGFNWKSELGQRRVVRSRTYTVVATEEFPNAPNELIAGTDALTQAHTTTPDANADPVDANNCLLSGISVPLGNSLTQTVAAGQAVIAGVTVNYAGQSNTFPSYSDTYRDLLPNGTMVFQSVSENGVPPAVTATALRIGVTTTYGSAVISDQLLCALIQTYGPRFDFPI